jgi:formylglycine-generating enzyme required for sulfatase activity
MAPVGTPSLGAGLWGQLDMAGDLYEWTLDWMAYSYGSLCSDCVVLTPGPGRVIRGGSYGSPASSPDLLSSTRTYTTGTRARYIGFRCARTP